MKKIVAIILVVALSAICLTGCGFFEEGEMDEGSVILSDTSTNTTSTKETSTVKSATVNTETAEINVEKVLLGDLSQDEVDNINGRINWLIGYTNDLVDELKGDTKANKKEIAKHEEEYKKFAEELEEELAAINEKLTKDADSIETIFERLDWQDFSIKKLANNVKIIFNTLSFYGKRIFNLEKNLKKETKDRIAADKALAAKDTTLTGSVGEISTSLETLSEKVEQYKTELENESAESIGVQKTRIDNLVNAINNLRDRVSALESATPKTPETPTEEPTTEEPTTEEPKS